MEKTADTLICHCFGYTVRDIEEDVVASGRSTILERIVAAKKLGDCRCAVKNPSGR
ncbi:hypothetical protein K9F62_16650 [Desulfovibrio sp. JY]|nr:hypothetical protein K9F62_16650 [Desulfovibrio sp. JY]